MTFGGAVSCLVLLAVSGTASAAPVEPAPEIQLPRHAFGVQVGGSAPFALTYRYRISGLLLLDVGGFGAPEALAIITAGLLFEVHRSDWWVVFVGAGGSGDIVGNDALAFGYARAGIGLRLGDRRQHQLALDVGAWCGAISKSDHVTHAHVSTDAFVIPMAGLSYVVGWGG
jgi:hypothetical protein